MRPPPRIRSLLPWTRGPSARTRPPTSKGIERAIEFPLQNQATLEGRIEQVNRDLGGHIAELTAVVRMQADSQGQLNQTLTTAITTPAEAQAKTEAKVDRLAGVVEKLVEGTVRR